MQNNKSWIHIICSPQTVPVIHLEVLVSSKMYTYPKYGCKIYLLYLIQIISGVSVKVELHGFNVRPILSSERPAHFVLS